MIVCPTCGQPALNVRRDRSIGSDAEGLRPITGWRSGCEPCGCQISADQFAEILRNVQWSG